MRKEYSLRELDIANTSDNPFSQFETWFGEALKADLPEPNAMHLATVGADGRPSGRVVLLKALDETGFVFYTNYGSRKAAEMPEGSWVALTFLWLELERQVRAEGRVERVSAEESDAYWTVRPRASQIGAWASPQSSLVADRQVLENRKRELEAQYADGQPIPRPPHWGGYRVLPEQVEFWQGRRSRLHDRILYSLDNSGNWTRQRLAP
ncbi:MAG: pyridoxamine 5'-phosphate oxidase [Cytophagales bacterium]|nr:pyridoxamine 5'-phosphate oxidase [Cytophagales bacterium]